MIGALYPVHVEATLDPHVSRFLWLVKWLLVVPHYIVLFFLWIAFAVLSVVAFFAILVTGRYPAGIFAFNVGVLRWTWRVGYYSYGALGTDRYPPFSLAEVPDYPAHLDVAYPERLSRGLVLVKWWLLAIPHYLVVGIFAGGGTWIAWEADRNATSLGSGGLIGLLVLIAAVVLAVTGRYPQQLFDLVLGLNRWVVRVAAYAALMTDAYPPFRLDMGGHEGTVAVGDPMPGGGGGGGGGTAVEAGPAPASGGAPAVAPSGWTAARVVSLVLGSLLALVSLALLAAGGAATWLDNTQRDAAGYLTSGTHTLSTGAYALTSDRIHLGSAADIFTAASVLGTVRIRVTPIDPSKPVFVGVAPEATVAHYLAGSSRAVVGNWADGEVDAPVPARGVAPTRPGPLAVWTAASSGKGTQTLTWKPTAGSWTVVVMNADGSPGVAVAADVAATVPPLGWIATGLLAGGGLLLVLGVVLVAVPAVRASRPVPATAASGGEEGPPVA